MSSIRRGHSRAKDARQAAREFYECVAQPDMALVLFFCSCQYDLEALADELKRLFQDVPLVGSTTDGEIGPEGVLDDSLTGVSFSGRDFAAASGHIENLRGFTPLQGHELSQKLLQKLWSKDAPFLGASTFALLLIDGRSKREEVVARSVQDVLVEIPMAGGSVSNLCEIGRTSIYVDGRFRSDCFALTLVSTSIPFLVRKTQHFVSTEQRLVTTAADPSRRIVYEINGLPAAEEYARLLGRSPRELTPEVVVHAPVVVSVNGTLYVRSIQSANSDGSLTFSCAIERGVVLRLARGVDIVENLEKAYDEIRSRIGPPQATIGFDCYLRRLEIEQQGAEKPIEEILLRNNTVGFRTFGEQYCGAHINHTFTCIAIGEKPGEARRD